jgi:hypothetical protein
MLRILAAVALATAPLVLTADVARACTCVPKSYTDYAKQADRVVLARAGKPIKTGDALEQTFTVIATFKGAPSATFKLDRKATPPCASNYVDGELAILFTQGSQLDPCHGNLPLSSIVAKFPAIVAGSKRADAPIDAIEVGLTEALTKYFHQRPAIPVRSPVHAGTSITIDKSKLTFGKTLAKDSLDLTMAFVVGEVAYLEGTYGREGVRFSVLLYLTNKTWKVASMEVVER